jgi:hypothetical protein
MSKYSDGQNCRSCLPSKMSLPYKKESSINVVRLCDVLSNELETCSDVRN